MWSKCSNCFVTSAYRPPKVSLGLSFSRGRRLYLCCYWCFLSSRFMCTKGDVGVSVFEVCLEGGESTSLTLVSPAVSFRRSFKVFGVGNGSTRCNILANCDNAIFVVSPCWSDGMCGCGGFVSSVTMSSAACRRWSSSFTSQRADALKMW